jgi:hypothetical protein
MQIIEKKELSTEEKIQISEIWNEEYPTTLSFTSQSGFDEYLNSLSNPYHYILQNENNEIKGWACKFERENEKWFAIILNKNAQGKGFGKKFMNAIKHDENRLCGWVIDKENFLKKNGDMYKSPLNFYINNSFNLNPDIRIDNEKLSAVKITWRSI